MLGRQPSPVKNARERRNDLAGLAAPSYQGMVCGRADRCGGGAASTNLQRPTDAELSVLIEAATSRRRDADDLFKQVYAAVKDEARW